MQKPPPPPKTQDKQKKPHTKQNKTKPNPVRCREKNISISISISWHLAHDWHRPPHSVWCAWQTATQGCKACHEHSPAHGVSQHLGPHLFAFHRLYPSAAHMGPTEKAAVGIRFSILPKLTLTKRTSDFKWVLHRAARRNDSTSSNTQEGYRPDDIVTISHRTFFSATLWDITITSWPAAIKLATHTHKTWK